MFDATRNRRPLRMHVSSFKGKVSRVNSSLMFDVPFDNEITGSRCRDYYLNDRTKMMTIALAVYIFLLSCLFAASLVETLQSAAGWCSLSRSSFHPKCQRSHDTVLNSFTALRERDQRRITRMMLLWFRPFQLPNLGDIPSLNPLLPLLTSMYSWIGLAWT